MGTIIKVVIGIIIGAVGFWTLDQYVIEGALVTKQTGNIKQEVPMSGNDLSHAQDNKVSNAQEKDEAGELESLTNEIESLKQEMEIKNQELLSSKLESKRLNAIIKGDDASLDDLKLNQNSANDKSSSGLNKFEGIPESHHSLLSRPESTPKATYELHNDLTSEEEDISWATMKEQQINHFLMSYKDSAQYIIHRVDCRSTLCEIIGTEHPSERDIWSEVTGQMRNQAWWEFIGSHTTSSTDSNGNLLFVTILQRNQGVEKAN
ncbi:hypothetical protein [Kangiella koreensis]|uniref:Uncharacterized protein n=1 Tax=Kangiella koreensis (strain DSM 16069 / JCM 12317 / KCTC 12182 / SW-125) TaxID=523791 RepID=C7R7E2_KANKD|nr:hypothetical protein [Kangiella koreensis]ACV25691.1 hypothetical protein Kkor_0270 [Kangiella koreensis DSM 16069]